jgi:hypothetical protein
MSDYVYPHSARRQLADAVASQIAAYLADGDVVAGVIGLDGMGDVQGDFQGLRFVQSIGSGVEGDETTYVTAPIIFADDEEPLIPRVKIVDVTFEGALQEWGDEEEQVHVRALLDCWSNEYTGTITGGLEPHGTDSLLAGWVYGMLSNFETMQSWGFHDANVIPHSADTAGINLHVPLIVTAEIYISKLEEE